MAQPLFETLPSENNPFDTVQPPRLLSQLERCLKHGLWQTVELMELVALPQCDHRVVARRGLLIPRRLNLTKSRLHIAGSPSGWTSCRQSWRNSVTTNRKVLPFGNVVQQTPNFFLYAGHKLVNTYIQKVALRPRLIFTKLSRTQEPLDFTSNQRAHGIWFLSQSFTTSWKTLHRLSKLPMWLSNRRENLRKNQWSHRRSEVLALNSFHCPTTNQRGGVEVVEMCESVDIWVSMRWTKEKGSLLGNANGKGHNGGWHVPFMMWLPLVSPNELCWIRSRQGPPRLHHRQR